MFFVLDIGYKNKRIIVMISFLKICYGFIFGIDVLSVYRVLGGK